MTEEEKKQDFSVRDLLELDKEQGYPIAFTVLSGGDGLDNIIDSEEIDRPGLPLAGFFESFSPKRIQILGRGEITFIRKLLEEGRSENIERLFSYGIPVCVVTYNLDVPDYLVTVCAAHKTPLLRTGLSSRRFMSLITTVLTDLFAPYVTIHGEFVSIHNVGVLITGKSGIGKSESVLGLIERGHKFICDDLVRIKKIRTPKGFELVGEPHSPFGPFIEIRGIGIINVSLYYGEGRVLQNERLGLIVELHDWDRTYSYDRLGLEERFENVLGMDVPYKQIPVSNGRNVPLLIEVAAYREIMRRQGYNSAEELDRKVRSEMHRKPYEKS